MSDIMINGGNIYVHVMRVNGCVWKHICACDEGEWVCVVW